MLQQIRSCIPYVIQGALLHSGVLEDMGSPGSARQLRLRPFDPWRPELPVSLGRSRQLLSAVRGWLASNPLGNCSSSSLTISIQPTWEARGVCVCIYIYIYVYIYIYICVCLSLSLSLSLFVYVFSRTCFLSLCMTVAYSCDGLLL